MMKIVLEDWDCEVCMGTNDSYNVIKNSTVCFDFEYSLCNQNANYRLINDQPILGPDRVSVEDCLTFARGTARSSRDLIILVRKPEIQYLLYQIIDDLETRALQCCRKGGIWKACLQPLVNKWHMWNEKYKLLGIPPDPSWD